MTVTATTAGTVVDAVRRWARERPGHAAFTFLDHEVDPRGVPVSITWAELDARARGLAGELRRRCAPGDRALLLLPQGLDYVVAFVACLYADVLAVPLFPIAGEGHRERLDGILRDCAPKLALTSAPVDAPGDLGLDVVVVGGVPPSAEPPVPRLGGPAYLQYTSGSTRTPAGVVVTDRNFRVNVRQALTAYGLAEVEPSPVSWLPLFHDMGLVLGVGVALATGAEAVLMDPRAFLYRPSRWLGAMSGRRNVISAGPNFAYDLCVRRVSAADRSGLDLSGVVALINGSEPVHAATVARFQDAFEPCGLRPDAQRPSYGLAEATVLVTAASRPTTTGFDRAALARGRVVVTEDPERASVLVGCGGAVDQHLAIVDPATGAPVEGDRVGEIWVCGENVSPGYWSGSRSGQDGFGARLDVPGLPDGPWLRTGDLGVLHEDQLYVVGRIKDLIVVDGRNHYPQDVEAVAAGADDVIRRGHVAAFAVPSDDGEVMVVVAERTSEAPRESVDQARVRARVRAAVSRRYDVPVRDVLVVEPGSVPRTSSGKLSRSACRDRYLAGDLPIS
ncbi:fatty acyl-AMP ligase [Saccharothrix saharensis]|uniref:fatty acyl-AMP ligase n=1 Tax=Saccharothrix saharensis TaxID=571190 RepID=UPI00368604A1